MRKNSPRKWLHAVLDLLPVILIPVFMIYSHRHDVASISPTEAETPIYYDTNEVDSVDDFISGNVYTLTYSHNTSITPADQWIQVNEYYIIRGVQSSFGTSASPRTVAPYLMYQNDNIYVVDADYTYRNFIDVEIDFIFNEEISNNLDTIISFFSACPRAYVKEYQQFIYNDVMSIFMDSFNNSIDKYFNMGNVFNLNGVYQWFNNNIFGGNAPQVIYSVWNIALYELVMDLLFLLYGLFMWFIDMVQHLMDKPFKSIK